MKIRGKLLVLLMLVALVPLGISAFLHYVSMYRFGRHLAAGWRQSLTASAHAHLTGLVKDFALLQARNEAALELALRIQAREVERLLASSLSARRGPKAADKERREKAGLTELYRSLEELSPLPAIRRLTVLDSGVQVEYPARTGDFPGGDRRRQEWFLRTKKSGETTWSVITGEQRESPLMIMAMPLRFPDGSFAGVTALEAPLDGWLDALRLPVRWSEKAEKLLVILADEEEGGGLRIVAARGEEVRPESPPREYLRADSSDQMAPVLSDIRAGRSGVRLLRYRGEEFHWVYGAHKSGRPFPVITIPHHAIIDQAEEAGRHVEEKMATELQITGLIFLGVILLVIIVAPVVARRVTRPLSRLAGGAEHLAAGDYQSRVEIRTGDEFQELGEIFNTLGPKLEERERMARSLAIAKEIQRRLFPQGPPQLAGFDISAQSISCEETGGDYYDFIELADGRLGLAVGDVSGHGIGAALLMTAARGVLRSYAGVEGGDPGRLFRALNRHLIQDVGDQDFMTLFYGEIDAGCRSLRWNSAGHGPILHYQGQTGEIKELPTTGIPLGIVTEATWEEAGLIALEVGDILLVGTDGLWEARSPAGEMFGIRRLREILAAHAEDSADEICAAAMSRVADFRGEGPPEDDFTLVVVRVAG